MKTKELHELTVNELNAKLKELSEELFNLRFRNAIGQLENSASLKNCKKAGLISALPVLLLLNAAIFPWEASPAAGILR